MHRELCRHGKAAPKAASIQDSLNLLLSANAESSRRSHDLRRHGLQIVFPHEPKWDAVTELRVQAGELGLDHSGTFSFGEHSDQLEGEPQTLFGITVKLASVRPPIDGAHVPDAADVGSKFAADEADELLDDFRDGGGEALHDALQDQGEMLERLPLEPPPNLNIHQSTSKKQLNYAQTPKWPLNLGFAKRGHSSLDSRRPQRAICLKNSRLTFPDVGSSGLKIDEAI